MCACVMQMDPGQSLIAVGSADELGNWSPDTSLALERAPGDIWSGSIQLPKETESCDFKVGDAAGRRLPLAPLLLP